MSNMLRLSTSFLALFALACGGSQQAGTDLEHCMLPGLDPDVEVTDLEVTTSTGSGKTDADIFVVIGLSDGTEDGLYIDDDTMDNFEPFTTETFVVETDNFMIGDVEHIAIQKDTALFEAGDWDLVGLTVTFLDGPGNRHVAYDNADGLGTLEGDTRLDLSCL